MMRLRMLATDQDPLDDRRWIVIADADEAAAGMLAGYLLHQRFRAYPTARGAEALRLAAAYPLGLAVIDVELADMAGCDLVSRLRAIDRAIPVVMTTADFGAETEVGARQLGISQYVQKPFDFRRLEAVARRIFASRLRRAAEVSEE